MKKIIIATALLLIAAIAFSVSAFGVNISFGQRDYNLGSFTTVAPTLDGTFGRYEYTTVYTLTSAGGFVDANGDALTGPMNSAGLTKSVKVGIAHDASFIYIAIESVVGADVEKIRYNIGCREYTALLNAEIDGLENDSDNEFSKFEKGIFVGEIRFAKKDHTDTVIASEIVDVLTNDPVAVIDASSTDAAVSADTAATSDTESVRYFNQYAVTEGEFELKILEETKDWRGNVINYSVWNAVKVSGFNRVLNGGNDFAYNTFTIGESASKVTVNNAPTTRPYIPSTVRPVTTAPVTTAPITTEPVTTEPVTTEPVTTAPAVTEPEETEPVATESTDTTDTPAVESTAPAQSESVSENKTESAPAVTEPAEKKGCGSTVTGMGIALVAIFGAGATLLSKKED